MRDNVRAPVPTPDPFDTDDVNGAVREMFDAISPRYDLLNRVLSGSLDRRWRQKAVSLFPAGAGGNVLDLCAGTGDLTFALGERLGPDANIIGADVSHAMLGIAMSKALRKKGPRHFVQADARHLPWTNDRFDRVTVAFGIRNVHPPGEGLAEIARVLRSGGEVVILEFFGVPEGRLGAAAAIYLQRLLPRVGAALSGHGAAYRYLPESMERFSSRAEFRSLMEGVGLRCDQTVELLGGVTTLMYGKKT